MHTELIIDEEELYRFGQFCLDRGELMDQMIQTLSVHVQDVTCCGIMSGKVTVALMDYADCLDGLKHQMTCFSGQISDTIQKFLEEIRQAESYRG